MANNLITEAYADIQADYRLNKLRSIDIENRYLNSSLLEEIDNDKYFSSGKNAYINPEKTDTVKDRIKANWKKLIFPFTDLFSFFKKKNKSC